MQREHEKTDKAERTKSRIVDAALELFREHGYEATTMRMVAERAGVSLGNAYYYFKSKDVLLQAFYRELHEAHLAACEPVLAEKRSLEDRLLGVLLARLEVTRDYHRFAALLFRQAADPKSPLNPFHPAGADVRHDAIAVFERVLEGTRIPKSLSKELPELLWMHSMGIVLYWIHDDSPDCSRTRALTEHTAHIVVRCIKLASNPLMRPIRQRVLRLLRELRIGGEP